MIDHHRRIALLDSNVLASITLTDVFVQLAVDDLFNAKWTMDIHREWIAAVRKFRPSLDPTRLEHRRRQMDAKTREALITGYESQIDDLTLPDMNDRHVLAAAIHGRCEFIVTRNLKHFPAKALSTHGIKAQHPDTFLTHLLRQNTLMFCAALRKVRFRAKNPPIEVEDFLIRLLNEGLIQTTRELKFESRLLL